MKINRKTFVFSLVLTSISIIGCNTEKSTADLQTVSVPPSGTVPTKFDGVWEVFGRTGNEDGSNEPVCGHETAVGTATIKGSQITGDIINKSGFEYTVEGTIDNNGKIKAMLLYSGYDAAELFGTFSAETNTAKGNWKDAVNACPGVWNATRVSSTETVPVGEGEGSENNHSEARQDKASG